MKKTISTLMLLAVAAAAFVSCQKAETAPQSELVTLTFSSSNPQTKTEWNGETVVWSAKDKIRMALKIGDAWYADDKGVVKYYVSNEAILSDNSETAQFKISASFKTELSGNYQFYALYPSNCTGSSTDFTNAPAATYTIGSDQTASSQTFDKSADILWGRAVNTYTALPETEISLTWTRLVAHADITLKGLGTGEKVNSVVLTAQDGLALVGKFNVDITTGAVSSNTPQNTVTVNCTDLTVDETGEASFWACINPCTITSLDIVVDTDAATYTISKTGFEREFLQNKRNTLPINMAGADRVPKETGEEGGDVDAKYYVKVTEAPEDWSGTYLLVCEEENIAMTGSATSNTDIKKPTSVEITQNGIQYNSAMENISVSINSVALGYLIVTRSGYGVYCTDSNTTFVASKTSSTYSQYPYTISLSDGKFVIMRGSKYMMYNKSSDVFGFYPSETQTAIQLYRLQSN